MASKQPASSSSSSRRAREAAHHEIMVGNYRRMEEIGRGSFATVYKAAKVVGSNSRSVHRHLTDGDQRNGNIVAMKSVDLIRLNKKLKENLYSEIHILKTLHHPHIVALIDCQENSTHIHLIMEFCEMGDLSYFIRKRESMASHPMMIDAMRKYPNPAIGGLNEVIVRHFLKQLASALQFLRAKNFIHRDVKPQNLLLDPSPDFLKSTRPDQIPFAAHDQSLTPLVGIPALPTLKLADFGFARSLPTTSLAETLCGSPLYMAPEILRYEKYDAKADLWSVGAVGFEMLVGKSPFRAGNHVDLLKKIERNADYLKVPEDVCASESLKKFLLALLKKRPAERISFEDFFDDFVLTEDIPGLAEEDRLRQSTQVEPEAATSKSEGKQREKPPTQNSPSRKAISESPTTTALRAERGMQRRLSGTPPRSVSGDLKDKRASMDKQRTSSKESSAAPVRPTIISHATAPGRQEMHAPNSRPVIAGQRRKSNLSSESRSLDKDSNQARRQAAQEVAFERDYVVVDKRNVEVNAFADEMAASPRMIHGQQKGALVRRATTQGSPATTGETKAMQIVSGKQNNPKHQRQSSYERRLRDAPSATSAISKAINMASGRLFNLGFSPPLGIGKALPSPPAYNPYPAFPGQTGSILMLQDGTNAALPLDPDGKTAQVIEDSAIRSNVVCGFAEIKFQQLIPATPSTSQIPSRGSEGDAGEAVDDDVDLNIEATVACAEEALVLFVKALSLLARSMNIARAWWARKNRAEAIEEARSSGTSSRTAQTTDTSNRVNNVVQWVRRRFNEVLEKAEFVRLKLIGAQQKLPLGHPNHPNNQPSASKSGMSSGSGDVVTMTSGVTAEKLMYDYAVDKSRSAAVNELVGENLPGCEIDYSTAIWLLEAILEDDDDLPRSKTSSGAGNENQRRSASSEKEPVNGVEAEDRETVLKRESQIPSWS